MSRRKPTSSGFTLIELLVVMLIISVLIALLIPAVNSARQAARSTQSKNNLKQIALATSLFQSAKGYFPPSSEFPTEVSGSDLNGWSAQALIIPYLEQSGVYADLDFTQNYGSAEAFSITTADGKTTVLATTRIPTYISPGEPRDEPKLNSTSGLAENYPINYAINMGTWFIFDPVTREGGNGAAYPGSRLKDSAFKDGLSNTLGYAEVKAWQPIASKTAKTNADLATALPNAVFSPTVTTPTMIAALGSIISGGSTSISLTGGHCEWIEGRVNHTGFTTVFRPNQKVMLGNSGTTPSVNAAGTGDLDIDWSNWSEGKGMLATAPTTTPTYAAVTARGYFAGIVNVSMMDGSVRSIDDKINLGVWRAISTRAGNEKIPNSFNQN